MLNEREANRAVGPTREELNQFLEDVSIALAEKVGAEIPEITAPRSVIEYYNRGNLKGFDEVGYFVFNNVKVFDPTHMEASKRRESLTIEEKLFGK